MPEYHSYVIWVPSGETSEHRWGTEIKHKPIFHMTLIQHPMELKRHGPGHKPVKPHGKGGKKK